MRIDYTAAGKAHTETEDQRKILANAIGRMKWETDFSQPVAFMPGEGIKAFIREFRIPKVSAFAISNELAPYGLYGVRASYKNADVDLFVVDEGSVLVPVCQYVTEKEGGK